MKKLLLFVAISGLFTSCVGPRKYAEYVQKAVEQTDTVNSLPWGGTRILTDSLEKFSPIVRVKKGAGYFIPVIIFTSSKETYHCEINPRIPVAYFGRSFAESAESLQLSRVLNSKRLELAIASIPGKFTYTRQEDVVFLFFGSITTGYREILPKNDDLIVRYKLYDGDKIVQTGTVTVRNPDTRYEGTPTQTRKKMTRVYIRQYEQNVRRMTRQCVLKLIELLK